MFSFPEAPFLELKALVLNINPGQNNAFMNQCKSLKEYMEYVTRVRRYRADMGLEKAVNRAVDECIREGILEDFFRKNKAEVVAMSIFEYDEKEVMDYIRDEAKEEEAQKYSRLLIRLTEEGKGDMIIKVATDDALRKRLYKEYQL